MALTFVHDFHMNIYQILATDPAIRSSVDRVYLSVVQDAKYPFLLINVLKIDDRSKFNQAIYGVELEICIFIKDKTPNILASLADKIISKLQLSTFVTQGYSVAGIKHGEITIQRSQDLVTSKLSIPYSVLLKQVLS